MTALVAAALSLLGTPFRLHGRDPTGGLDCAGLIEAALARCGVRLTMPTGYTLRARRVPELGPILIAIGMEPASAPIQSGDVLLLRPASCLHHIAIATGPDRIVHAHAGLRRVVHSPLPDAWPILGHWRLQPIRS